MYTDSFTKNWSLCLLDVKSRKNFKYFAKKGALVIPFAYASDKSRAAFTGKIRNIKHIIYSIADGKGNILNQILGVCKASPI